MDLKRIEIFCKIVDLKSFTRAAEEVRLAQPTVSEHMRLLEDELGEKLLERSGRNVLLTPAGKLFHQYARRLLLLRDEALQALAGFRGDLSGKLLIGASTIPGAYLLPEQLQRFKAEHPAIELSLKIASTQQTLSDLLDGKLELALTGASSKHSQLEFTPLAKDQLVLVVNSGHPWVRQPIITPQQLRDQPFILREEGSGTRSTMTEALQPLGIRLVDLSVVAEMGNNEAVREAVKAGIGAAIISRQAVAEELTAGTLEIISVKGLNMSRHIYLVRHQRRSLSPLAEAFFRHLLAQNFD
jgi:DNA-binding transcriptional LysR family regulator